MLERGSRIFWGRRAAISPASEVNEGEKRLDRSELETCRGQCAPFSGHIAGRQEGAGQGRGSSTKTRAEQESNKDQRRAPRRAFDKSHVASRLIGFECFRLPLLSLCSRAC